MSRLRPALSALLGRVLLLLIRFYQGALSPWLGPANCRFVPTCSEYARQAIAQHGPWRGARLALRRIGRCHPWGGQGYDPVPPPEDLSEAPPAAKNHPPHTPPPPPRVP